MQFYHLKLSGSLTIGHGDVLLRRQVDQAVEQGYSVLVVDFSQVTYMDSATVGQLAHSYQVVTHNGGNIALVGLRPKVRRLLQIMSFLDIFPVFDSLEDALQILAMKTRKTQPLFMSPEKLAV